MVAGYKKTRLISDQPGFSSGIFQLSLLNGCPVQIFLSNIESSRPNETIILILFDVVCGPAGNAAHCEDTSEQVRLDADGVVNCSGEKVYVGIDIFFILHGL